MTFCTFFSLRLSVFPVIFCYNPFTYYVIVRRRFESKSKPMNLGRKCSILPGLFVHIHPQGQSRNIFLFATGSRPALGPTQLPVQWVSVAVSLGLKRQGVKLTTHLQLMPS
jgi:hypothetical protein